MVHSSISRRSCSIRLSVSRLMVNSGLFTPSGSIFPPQAVQIEALDEQPLLVFGCTLCGQPARRSASSRSALTCLLRFFALHLGRHHAEPSATSTVPVLIVIPTPSLMCETITIFELLFHGMDLSDPGGCPTPILRIFQQP